MRVFAIDPGSEQSAFVLYDAQAKHHCIRDTGFCVGCQRLPAPAVRDHGIVPNGEVLAVLNAMALDQSVDACAVEMIVGYGMTAGRELFETCVFTGRVLERWEFYRPANTIVRIPRREVKIAICDSHKAKDSEIRDALITRFGPGKEKAIGKKATPGPLFGVKADEWAALAVAVTFAETIGKKQEAA